MKITSKGQVTIPNAFRQKYKLLPNTEISFVEGREGLVLKKAKTVLNGKSRGEKIVARLRGSATSEYRTWTTEKLMKLLRG